MPTTLEDIARALNVSKMTVSRAINNHPEISRETRARILAAAQKMNYRPNQFARALTTNHSYLIGIVVPDLMHSFFSEICRGVESQARPEGYQNLICSTDEEPQKEMDEIEALLSRTDGLIVASAFSSKDLKFYRRLLNEGAKIVLIDRLLDGLRCSAVTTDDVQVGGNRTSDQVGSPSNWSPARHECFDFTRAFAGLQAGDLQGKIAFREIFGA
jgi:LacI family transcriptional regulator